MIGKVEEKILFVNWKKKTVTCYLQSDICCTCEVKKEEGEGESVMELQTDKCCTSELNMEEGEKYDVGESVMELQTGKCCKVKATWRVNQE